jgi:NAD(P)-dependent dehydrogenase (short-subunit alcohol dehydrogenase family)
MWSGSFTGRSVVVTGANRGLGLELCRQLSAAGATVLASCRTPERASELAALQPAALLSCDVGDAASVAAFGAALAARTRSVDLLINNAGINGLALGAPKDDRHTLAIDPEVFLGEVRVNAVGPMLVTRALLPLLEGGGEAVIVNVSSQLGSMAVGLRAGSDVGYNASKAALNMVTARTSAELAGRGITTICVHPGWVQTDMGGPGAAMTPADSAAALLGIVARLGPADNGRFIDYTGDDHPW